MTILYNQRSLRNQQSTGFMLYLGQAEALRVWPMAIRDLWTLQGLLLYLISNKEWRLNLIRNHKIQICQIHGSSGSASSGKGGQWARVTRGNLQSRVFSPELPYFIRAKWVSTPLLLCSISWFSCALACRDDGSGTTLLFLCLALSFTD